MSKNRRQSTLWPFAALAIVAVIVAVRLLSNRPEPLVATADNLLEATFAADGHVWARHLTEEESRVNTLSPESIHAILKQVVLPNFSQGKRMSRRIRQLNTGQGVSEDRLEFSGGFSLPVSVSTYAINGKARACLSEMVRQSWIIRYRAETRAPYGYAAIKQATIQGTARDGERLRTLGLTVLFRPNPATGSLEREDLAELAKRAAYWATRPDEEMRAAAKADD